MSRPAPRLSASTLVWLTGLAVAVITVAGNLTILGSARVAGAAMTTTTAGPVGPGQVVTATVATVAAGTLLLWLSHQRGPRMWTRLAILGGGFGALSLIGPLTLATTAGTIAALVGMHLFTAIVWVVALRRGARTVTGASRD